MAGSLTLSADGVVVHSVALDGTQADIELAWRNAVKTRAYTGTNADTDPIATVGEFLCLFFALEIDTTFLTIEKKEGNESVETTFDLQVSKQTVGSTSTA